MIKTFRWLSFSLALSPSWWLLESVRISCIFIFVLYFVCLLIIKIIIIIIIIQNTFISSQGFPQMNNGLLSWFSITTLLLFFISLPLTLEHLQTSAQHFERSAVRLKRKFWWQNIKVGWVLNKVYQIMPSPNPHGKNPILILNNIMRWKLTRC